MKRRDFLKNSLAASALVSLSCAATAQEHASQKAPVQEYYELRAYRLKSAATEPMLDEFLSKAALPAFNRLGIKPVGVFGEIQPKDPPTVFVLIPYANPAQYAGAVHHVAADPDYLKAGAAYLGTPKSNPVYDRIDSWFMLAFAGMPKIVLPAYSKERKPRLFEMRTYESYSESKALKKVAMFNNGEIDAMHEVGLAPIFYGQALTGPNLPHLTYMTSAENEEAHKKHWDAFGKHPKWDQLKNDPQYADTVSKITKWFLTPKPYSQI